MTLRAVLAAALLGLALAGGAQAAEPRLVKPSQVDAAVTAFDDPNVVIAPPRAGAPLAVFLPGTGGKPDNVMPLLRAVGGQGYAVIGLEYPDEPAVVGVCPRDPDPACSADFRQMRLFGDGASKTVSNTLADSISGRLAALLAFLAKDRPTEGWDAYLKDGKPDWTRILVSGQSQGAGMAAYLAKQSPVYRVVLFSSPWDFQVPGPKLAPWIAGPSATPMDRWYGVYNSREKTADLLAQSYAALAIPADHIRVLTLDLPPGVDASKSPNPYHGQGIKDRRYADVWRFAYGEAPTATTNTPSGEH